jgi:hypothetical protein
LTIFTFFVFVLLSITIAIVVFALLLVCLFAIPLFSATICPFFFNGSNDFLTHQKIEPGFSSVVESMGQDFWYFLFTAALDILAGS